MYMYIYIYSNIYTLLILTPTRIIIIIIYLNDLHLKIINNINNIFRPLPTQPRNKESPQTYGETDLRVIDRVGRRSTMH